MSRVALIIASRKGSALGLRARVDTCAKAVPCSLAMEEQNHPVHDRGGWPNAGPIDRTEHQLDDWEYLAEGISGALSEKGIRCTDESRRAMESLPPDVYESLKYYER